MKLIVVKEYDINAISWSVKIFIPQIFKFKNIFFNILSITIFNERLNFNTYFFFTIEKEGFVLGFFNKIDIVILGIDEGKSIFFFPSKILKKRKWSKFLVYYELDRK